MIDGAGAWYSAFWDLCTDRQMGGRIGYSAARAYGRDCGWSDDEFQVFWRVIRAMDGVYLEHVSSDGPKTFTREAFRGAFSGK